jgi:hypothetical protein
MCLCQNQNKARIQMLIMMSFKMMEERVSTFIKKTPKKFQLISTKLKLHSSKQEVTIKKRINKNNDNITNNNS